MWASAYNSYANPYQIVFCFQLSWIQALKSEKRKDKLRSPCAGNQAFVVLRGFAVTLGHVYYEYKFRGEIKSALMVESCRMLESNYQ